METRIDRAYQIALSYNDPAIVNILYGFKIIINYIDEKEAMNLMWVNNFLFQLVWEQYIEKTFWEWIDPGVPKKIVDNCLLCGMIFEKKMQKTFAFYYSQMLKHTFDIESNYYIDRKLISVEQTVNNPLHSMTMRPIVSIMLDPREDLNHIYISQSPIGQLSNNPMIYNRNAMFYPTNIILAENYKKWILSPVPIYFINSRYTNMYIYGIKYPITLEIVACIKCNDVFTCNDCYLKETQNHKQIFIVHNNICMISIGMIYKKYYRYFEIDTWFADRHSIQHLV